MECELCGRQNANVRAEVEGTSLTVCEACSRLGRRLDPVVVEMKGKNPAEIGTSSINPKFASIVMNARKKLGISIEELGKRINEKTSVIERVEKGMRPTDALARKIEKALKIKLLDFE